MPEGRRVLRILGIRGLPAAHGGFETFAERLALHLVARGWRVIVYCQHEGTRARFEDTWRGIERIHVCVPGDGALGTVRFDFRATRDAARHRDPCLTLGYNTAVFCTMLRLAGVPNVINMDGIEWRRRKWGPIAKAWFWLNDWMGCWLGDHLVADHPRIAEHLRTRFVDPAKISTIPYGSDRLEKSRKELLDTWGLVADEYLTVVARAEPENSILEIVESYGRRRRGVPLVVVGNYGNDNPYHRKVKAAAGDEVRFVGAIYATELLQALRAHSLAYVHGHQVGGTNPSLVEALGAGNPVLAHDNPYNRWVAGDAARYFSSREDLDAIVELVLRSAQARRDMKSAAARRHADGLTWGAVLAAYEEVLDRFTL